MMDAPNLLEAGVGDDVDAAVVAAVADVRGGITFKALLGRGPGRVGSGWLRRGCR